MTREEQLKEWVEGNSIHNEENDVCCPDFSCCEPKLLASRAEREAFAKAYKEGDERTVDNMLMMFLGAMLPGAYIAGDEANYRKEV